MIKRLKRRLLGSIINSARHKFCERIVDRALLKKWPVTRIHEPFTLDLPMPDGFAYDEQSRMAFESEQHLKFPAQYLACIPNASVLAGFEAVSRKQPSTCGWEVRDLTGWLAIEGVSTED